jgi:hypothetical protein
MTWFESHLESPKLMVSPVSAKPFLVGFYRTDSLYSKEEVRFSSVCMPLSSWMNLIKYCETFSQLIVAFDSAQFD